MVLMARLENFLGEEPLAAKAILQNLTDLLVDIRTRKMEYFIGRTLNKSKAFHSSL
jgi:hypothetical protein